MKCRRASHCHPPRTPCPPAQLNSNWETGSGLTIRDQEGEVAHALGADGSATHAAEVTATGFHVVVDGDTLISFNADGTSYHSGLEEYAGGILVHDELVVSGDNGEVVIGEANPQNPTGEIGVRVNNEDGELVGGLNRRDLDTGQTIGVAGRALNEGDLAGYFYGDVEIEGGGLYILSPDGDTLTAFFPDGTSYHSGLEEYAGGIKISGDGNGIEFADGSSMTTAPTGGGAAFNGVLQGTDLVIKDAQGNETIRLNSDGTSFHSGQERFAGGIVVDEELIMLDSEGRRLFQVTEDGIVLVDEQNFPVTMFNRDGTSFHLGEETYAGGITLDGSALVIKDDNGEVVTQFNPDGTSHHYGLETFWEGANVHNGLLVYDNEGRNLFQITDGGLALYDEDNIIVTEFNRDGTSYHGGLETYAGGLKITGEGNGIEFADGTSMTTAPTDGSEFDGTLVGKDLIVLGLNGQEAFRVNADGTSHHYGLETFYDGIAVDNGEVVIRNGNGDAAVTIGTDEEGSGRIHSTGSLRLGNSIVIDGVAHTIDSDDPLEILVAGLRALRLEPHATSPNVIGGYRDNAVTPGAFGGTIGGGGANGSANTATDNYGTVAGGFLEPRGRQHGCNRLRPICYRGRRRTQHCQR